MDIPPLLRPGRRAGTSGEEILGRVGKGGVTARAAWPEKLLRVIGEPAAAEVEKAAISDIPLSKAIEDYLKNLESNSSRSIPEQVEVVYDKIKLRAHGKRR